MSTVGNLVKMIESKTEKKEKKIVSDAETDRFERIKLVKEECDIRAARIIREARKKLTADMRRFEASTKLKAKQEILRAKNTIIQDIIDSAMDTMRKTVKKKKYKKIVLRLAVEGGVLLNSKNIELVFPKDQNPPITAAAVEKALKKASGGEIEVELSDESVRASGGVVIRTKDHLKSVDNTFEGRFQRMEQKIRADVFTLIFSVGEAE